jgi:hypothetical protein
MSNPVSVAASEILTLAFNEFIKSSSGEVAKKLAGEALKQAQELRCKITGWFNVKGDTKALQAIKSIEEESSEKSLSELTTYLENEMNENSDFADELRHILLQIAQPQQLATRIYNNYGRDQINIDRIQGSIKLGGS